MLALFETPAGYAVFDIQKPKVLEKTEDIEEYFSTPDKARKIVRQKEFEKFQDSDAAVKATLSISEGTQDENLKNQQNRVKNDSKDSLAVIDQKIGNQIKDKLGIKVIYNAGILEQMRGIRSQIDTFIVGQNNNETKMQKLGQSHGLARYTLVFSPDKVDTMIIHAISLLDEQNLEVNNYCMRIKEWYGLHFPEMSKLLQDSMQYVRIVRQVGFRTSFSKTDLSNIIDNELEIQLREASEVSMGTDIADEDIKSIFECCDQVIELDTYRTSLLQYLQDRMNAIAPNLTMMVGELVGARLISHAGSLINLAKQPSSTVQIFGAEKALFRALKTKHDTPKYGLIYHASLIGQAEPKLKGKIARTLAAKTSLAIREDAFGEKQDISVGLQNRAKVEARLRQLETSRKQILIAKSDKVQQDFKKYKRSHETSIYNDAHDMTMGAKNNNTKR